MVESKRIILILLLSALPLAVFSCQQAPNAVAKANSVEKLSQPNANNRNSELRSWPGAYPQPTGLKGLKSVALRVYAARGIPSGRIASGPFADEIENRIIEKLKVAGITLVNEKEAESVLGVSMYLSCQPDGSSCGHLTTLELRQWVQLERDPSITVAAITWHNSYSNGMSKNELQCCLPALLAVDVGALMNGFIHDYHTANP